MQEKAQSGLRDKEHFSFLNKHEDTQKCVYSKSTVTPLEVSHLLFRPHFLPSFLWCENVWTCSVRRVYTAGCSYVLSALSVSCEMVRGDRWSCDPSTHKWVGVLVL